MAVLPKFIEGAAFGSLNTVLSHFLGGDGKDGYALPSRYEVIITPPGKPDPAAKKTSLRCESISLPGMNLTSTPDSNMYGVPAEIVDGVSSFRDAIRFMKIHNKGYGFMLLSGSYRYATGFVILHV